MGAAAMAAQILMMRRLIVVFGGNELVTGGVLAGWLFFSGLGNLIAAKFADRLKDAELLALISLLAMALLIPATLAATYFVKTMLGLPAPAMTGLGTAIAASMVAMAPLGFFVGTSFTLACRLPGGGRARDLARVYLFDALGAGIGGLFLSAFALRYLSAMQSSVAAALLLTVAIAYAAGKSPRGVAAAIIAALLLPLLLKADALDSWLTSVQWRGYNPVAHRESLFATLMVTDNRGERTLFSDSRPSFSLPLPETYESIAFTPLLEHPDPRKILVVEGGISGVLDQFKKLDLESAEFTRLDPDATLLERDDMPSDLAHVPKWAGIDHMDGRGFIRNQKCDGGCFDVIIINVGEPDTAAADRYYTREFFKEAEAALRPGGIICLALMETTNYVSSEVAALLGGIEVTLDSIFANVIILPLDRYYFIASDSGQYLTSDIDELLRRLDRRDINAPFLKYQGLPGIFPERVAKAQEVVAKAASESQIDSDRTPHAYFNGLMLWERRAGGTASPLASLKAWMKLWVGIAIIAALAVASLAIARRKKGGESIAMIWALFATGFASIVYEIALLVFYQMSVGLLVWKMGFIITAFMVGAGTGAWTASISEQRLKGVRALLAVLALSAIYIQFMFAIGGISAILANFVMGLLTGFIYQRAAASLAAQGLGIGAVAGIAQNSDLWGAAAGSIVASAVVIPLAGLSASLWIASSILAAAVVIVQIISPRTRSPGSA